MFYFLHGTDTDKARAKARELITSLQKKKPEAELFRVEGDSWSEARFDELISSQGLFERKYIVFVKRLFENKEAKEKIVPKLEAVAASENVFIFLEAAVDKATFSALAKHAEKVQAFEKIKTKKVEPPNIFALADALGARDRKVFGGSTFFVLIFSKA